MHGKTPQRVEKGAPAFCRVALTLARGLKERAGCTVDGGKSMRMKSKAARVCDRAEYLELMAIIYTKRLHS